MAEEKAVAVPLVELLRAVPLDAVWRINTTNALGCVDTRSIPVGRLCHAAADRIEVEPAAKTKPASEPVQDAASVEGLVELAWDFRLANESEVFQIEGAIRAYAQRLKEGK